MLCEEGASSSDFDETAAVLSEVHVASSKKVSEFWFAVESVEDVEDEDGDLVVPRRQRIRIEHSLATPVSEVGKQIWRGGLVLCDWYLEDPRRVEGKRVLELGAGTGISAVVAARLGADVTATDIYLDLLRRNVEANGCETTCAVAELDWARREKETWRSLLETSPDPYDLAVAADVVYDDELTGRFFDVLRAVKARRVVVCLELRFNFELESLSVRAHGYRRFQKECRSHFPQSHKMLDVPPQRLHTYDRHGAKFELWEFLRCFC